jgi:hypothetical protein
MNEWLSVVDLFRHRPILMTVHPNEPAAPEAPRRRFRKLRIAWSMVWGVLCVLLIALWLRSYRWVDLLTLPINSTRTIQIGTFPGDVVFRAPPVSYYRSKGDLRSVASLREHRSWPFKPSTSLKRKLPSKAGIRWSSQSQGSDGHLIVPYWMMVALSGTMSVLPLKSKLWRFGLRTLLIATTLIAVLLGLLVWLR